MKDDGLIASFAEYEALDERVVADWRLLTDARQKLSQRVNKPSRARR